MQGKRFLQFRYRKPFKVYITEAEICIVGDRALVSFEAGVDGKLHANCLHSGFEVDSGSLDHHVARLPSPAKTYYFGLSLPMFTYLRLPYVLHKIVLISAIDGVDSNYSSLSDVSVVALLRSGQRLALLRLDEAGVTNWDWHTAFYSQSFEDIVTYKGQLCAIDHEGKACLMDYHSLELTQVAGAVTSLCRELNDTTLGAFTASGGGKLYLVATSHVQDHYKAHANVYELCVELQKWVKVEGEAHNQCFVVGLNYAVSIDVWDAERCVCCD